MLIALALTAYFVIGFLLWRFYDRLEMAKDVPYGDMPAIAPLETIRRACAVNCVLFWLPVLAWMTIRHFATRPSGPISPPRL